MDIHPVTLTGEIVRLEPLARAHIPALWAAGCDPAIWRYMVYGTINSVQDMENWVEMLLARQADGTDLPFAVYHCQAGTIIGATRYLDIHPEHRGLEIGGTWYTPDFQRTAVNTECKYLLLKHAFEALGCVRVQFKTDSRNERSQKALERIGAVKEGILRNHIITPEGYVRDSVFYSIIDREWPVVKSHLEKLLQKKV
jgi:RimJ/RimL family protein N-acetyltransferase